MTILEIKDSYHGSFRGDYGSPWVQLPQIIHYAAIGLHYGLTYGIQPEELQEMDVITFWGNNAKVSSSHQWSFASKARKNREVIIVDVDPRKSPTSEAADIWLNPRPGSDVALAYGIARYIILNKGVNRKFIDEWTDGYEKFEKEALSWTPNRVEQVTGLSWNQIETAGDLYIDKRPAAFVIGLVLQKSCQGTEAVRAISLLPAATYYEKTDVNFSDHHLYSRLSNKAIEPLGESRHEIKVMQEIAGRLKLSESWLYEDPWQALEIALKEAFTEKSLADILNGEVLKLKLRPDNEYQTPSGKIEFSSSRSFKIGVQEIPIQTELKMDGGRYLLLNSSIPNYTHSQFTDVYGPIPQIVWINKEDAKKSKIHDGNEVLLHNELGEVRVKAIVNEKVSKGVLWAPRPLTGLEGNPLNVLAPGTSQIIGGGPNFNSIRVKIRKLP